MNHQAPSQSPAEPRPDVAISTPTSSGSAADVEAPAVTPSERRGLGIVLKFLIVAAVIGLILAAAITRSWTMFFIALATMIAYGMLLLAPVLLANVTDSNRPPVE